jgi:hypothetical protein
MKRDALKRKSVFLCCHVERSETSLTIGLPQMSARK